MSNKVIIDYYTDVLCIWAWVSQHRVERLQQELGDNISIQFHYIDVFGDTHTKMKNQWAERGSFDGFAKHVTHSASEYPTAIVNEKIWKEVKPTTSTNAHILLKAVELSDSSQKSEKLALLVREAFYVNAQDISDMNILFDIAKQAGLELHTVKKHINNGSAVAALMSDYQQAKQLALKGSPTYLIDNGRQTLFGNVNYQTLKANITPHLI